MQTTTVHLPEEQLRTVERIVQESMNTDVYPAMSKATVLRAIFAAGMDSLAEGGVEVDETDLADLLDGDVPAARESDESGETPVECHKCGYAWGYTGTLAMATCPSCSAKVPVDRDD